MPKAEARSPLRPPSVAVGDPGATALKSKGGAVPTAAVDSPKVATAYATVPAPAVTDSLKLIIGAGGIYAAFLYYGTLQEDVFHYTSSTGDMFKYAWFLQLIESLSNVLVGGVGLLLAGATPGLPQKPFAISGVSQVCAKAFTSLSLASGVSFPVVTLAKSGKMIPVMAGSLLLGGASYSLREYLSVLAIIAGTAFVSMGKKSASGENSIVGLSFILLSLTCDGVTGGLQKKMMKELGEIGVKPKPYDFMFWTNLYMGIAALVVSIFFGEFQAGIDYCIKNPALFEKIVKFGACSAIGQSFIFYTIANFDPLVCTTVTTTRKVFSVLLSIVLKGHSLTNQGWGGLALASGGILSELLDKFYKKKTNPAKKDLEAK
jgi:UDP-galactose transporter B1